MKKSQSSFEFLLVFGIGLTLILLMSGIFLSFSNESKKELDEKQLNRIAEEIIRNVEKVYFWGSGNTLTIEASFPEGIGNMTIHHLNLNGQKFDVLNFTYENEKIITYSLFQTKETYIYFNCSTSCENSVSISPEHNVSYYTWSDFSSGKRRIRIKSMGDWVAVDFFKE